MMNSSMKVGNLVMLLLFVVTIASAQQKVNKALFIIADGIPANVIERCQPQILM